MKTEKKHHTREIPAIHSTPSNVATKQFADNRPSNAIQILQKQIMQRRFGCEKGFYLPPQNIENVMQRHIVDESNINCDFSIVASSYKYAADSPEYEILQRLCSSDVHYSFKDIPEIIRRVKLHKMQASKQEQVPLIPGGGHKDGFDTTKKNEILEECIGHCLNDYQRVKDAAKAIYTITSACSAVTDKEIQQRACSHRGTWAGAEGYLCYGTSTNPTEKGRLGINEYVYAATQHQEITMKAALGEGYKAWREQYPVSNVLHQRLEGITFDCTNDKVPPNQWPKRMKSTLCRAYNILRDERYSDEDFIGYLQLMYDHKDKGYSKLLMDLRSNISTDLVGDNLPPFVCSSKLGSGVRQGSAGAQHNVIIDDSYIKRAEELKKPLLSGPSGTAFRFVRGWAHIMALQKIGTPSIEDALLVSMANLLPPNTHHSYHEIMDGVVGVGGLQYTDPSGYGDIEKMCPGIIDAAIRLSLRKLHF